MESCLLDADAVCILHRQAWQGNTDVMIDRYDVRTHIDHITEATASRRTYIALQFPIYRLSSDAFRNWTAVFFYLLSLLHFSAIIGCHLHSFFLFLIALIRLAVVRFIEFIRTL